MSLEIDRKTYLAVALMLRLARNDPHEIYPSLELAEELCISESYLQQVCKHLRKNKLLVSHRGPRGGYSLAKSPNKISIADILVAMSSIKTSRTKKMSLENKLWIKLDKDLLAYLNSIFINNMVGPSVLTRAKKPSLKRQVSYLEKLII